MARRYQAQTHENIARRYKTEYLSRAFSPIAHAAKPAKSARSSLDVIPPGHNVLGVGYGAKVTSGAAVEGQIAVRVYVRAKLPQSALSPTELVPPYLNGMPTDVIAVGDVSALSRPVACGGSIGHVKVTAGTLACLVEKSGGPAGIRYILSNNHILANSNQAGIGDPILAPGPLDGGDPKNPLAKLTEFHPLDFHGPNAMDAAIAELLSSDDATPEIANIGRVVNPPAAAALHQSVRKQGRTTQHTIGLIADLSADIRVRYGMNMANFEDQIAITGAGGAFSSTGDSGALVVDAVSLHPIALVFAGGTVTTFANPIVPVLSRFGVEIV
jgi:hypothetical protein